MENESAKIIDVSDRISQLPDVVLHHILCFLSQKEAVQTCVLSKSWRHLGPTRPVIDIRGTCGMDHRHVRGINYVCENCFHGNDEAFLSVVEKTFQKYHHQNLSPRELSIQMLELDPQSVSVLKKWIPIFIKPNSCVTTFRLSVDKWIHNPDRIPGTRRSFDLPSVVFKAESLQNLHLYRCKISSIENVVLKHLQKLSLSFVDIDDETLKKVMSCCPFLEYLELDCCHMLKDIISIGNENQYLKGFKFINRYSINIELDVIEIDVPTLQSIHIEVYSFRKKNNPDNYFPLLKSFFLSKVQLSTEFFENFSCNFPLLQEFTLSCCRGFEEIKLFSHSLKHLTIRLHSSIKVDINVPNILRFMFSGWIFPTTISLTTASREWKSQITLTEHWFFYDYAFQHYFELNEMVKAISQSQISLDVSECMFYSSKQIECGINNDPVAVELLNISSSHRLLDFNAIPSLFYALFQICRPRYVIASNGFRSPRYDNGSHGSLIGELPNCIWETLIHERENKEYFWQQHLEEVSIEAYDYEEKVWLRVLGKCLPESCASNHKKIRFVLKWRD